MKPFEKRKLKYESKDTTDQIFKQIKKKADLYFSETKNTKNGNIALWIKFTIMLLILIPSYFLVLHATSYLYLTLSYILFGMIFLIIGINIGHDAAHHCVSGNRKVDNLIFNLIFSLQGLSGYFWQIRHNSSHHIFPNVYHNDSDLESSGLILLHPHQKAHSIHKYQHYYAPFLYMLFSLIFIFGVDFSFYFRKEQANLKFKNVPISAFIQVIATKIAYLTLFLVLPIVFCPLGAWTIVGAFFSMHLVISIFLSFTFFISHHVEEVPYIEADHANELVHDAWTHHQVITTIDFNPDSKIANFIFGGFNLHIAHHLFPEVSHIHYPALTKIIKETFEENKVDWYKSFSFFEGVASHLRHLKHTANQILVEKEAELSHSNG